ncbi:MAG: hypothetical protein M0R73_03205 [Dehalococcoidia bacterium]|nr:hypothetical protein [Dehalococcoidia bacterium]
MDATWGARNPPLIVCCGPLDVLAALKPLPRAAASVVAPVSRRTPRPAFDAPRREANSSAPPRTGAAEAMPEGPATPRQVRARPTLPCPTEVAAADPDAHALAAPGVGDRRRIGIRCLSRLETVSRLASRLAVPLVAAAWRDRPPSLAGAEPARAEGIAARRTKNPEPVTGALAAKPAPALTAPRAPAMPGALPPVPAVPNILAIRRATRSAGTRCAAVATWEAGAGGPSDGGAASRDALGTSCVVR